jgi:hypothetical protein
VLRVGGNADIGAQLGVPASSRGELAAFVLERAGWRRVFASLGATRAEPGHPCRAPSLLLDLAEIRENRPEDARTSA